MAGLLATENISAAEHFFEYITVADSGACQRDVLARKYALEAQVGHGRGDDAVAFEFILRFEVARDGKKHTVAVHDFSRFTDEERTVSVTVESNSETRLLRDDAFLQALQVQRTAAGVDVAAVG